MWAADLISTYVPFHHQLRRGITINSSDGDFRSSCWWGCGLGVRSLFYGAFDWEHQSSIACKVVEEAALVIFRGGDNVNTYFSHLSRPSLEGYSIYVGSMLSFLLKSEHWSVGHNIGINMQSKFTLLRPLWVARCLVELRANNWYTISRPCPVLMLRWRMKMTLMKMIRLSLFRLILRLIRWNNPHLSPRGFYIR